MAIKLGFCIMVKNEENNLERTLNSILPYVDYYLIVDTGSTDNTLQTLKDILSRYTVKGDVNHVPFENFSQVRNYMLRRMKGKCDYFLYMDAGDFLVGGYAIQPLLESQVAKDYDFFKFKIHMLSDDMATNIQYSSLTFRLMKSDISDKGWSWKCPVHEVLYNEDIEEPSSVYVDERTVRIEQNSGNDRESTLKRNTWDIEVMEKEIDTIDKTCRLYNHMVYHLMKTYMAQEMYDKVVSTFKKTNLTNIKNDEFKAQLYYVCGRGYRKLNDAENALKMFAESARLDNRRCEHLYFIAATLVEQNNYEEANKYIEMCMRVNKSIGKSYTENEVYDFYRQKLYDHIKNKLI